MLELSDTKVNPPKSRIPNEFLFGLANSLREKYFSEITAEFGTGHCPVYIEPRDIPEGKITDSDVLMEIRKLRDSLASLGYEILSLDPE